MKDTTETICQRDSSEIAQQNFEKLFSYEGHNVQIAVLIQFFFLGVMLFFELKNLANMKDTTETIYQRDSSEIAQQNFEKLCSY